MSQVAPFRLTPEDLPDLDKKTREGLVPLLEALNSTLQQLVATANGTAQSKTITSTFTSGPLGTAYVDIAPSPIAKPFSAELNQIYRTDLEPMTTPFSLSWQMTATVARLLFAGLANNTEHRVTVTLR